MVGWHDRGDGDLRLLSGPSTIIVWPAHGNGMARTHTAAACRRSAPGRRPFDRHRPVCARYRPHRPPSACGCPDGPSSRCSAAHAINLPTARLARRKRERPRAGRTATRARFDSRRACRRRSRSRATIRAPRRRTRNPPGPAAGSPRGRGGRFLGQAIPRIAQPLKPPGLPLRHAMRLFYRPELEGGWRRWSFGVRIFS
jgi:hypothetical protein